MRTVIPGQLAAVSCCFHHCSEPKETGGVPTVSLSNAHKNLNAKVVVVSAWMALVTLNKDRCRVDHAPDGQNPNKNYGRGEHWQVHDG